MKPAHSVMDLGVFTVTLGCCIRTYSKHFDLSGSGANLSNTSVPFILPGEPGNLVTDYPEWWVELKRFILQ